MAAVVGTPPGFGAAAPSPTGPAATSAQKAHATLHGEPGNAATSLALQQPLLSPHASTYAPQGGRAGAPPPLLDGGGAPPGRGPAPPHDTTAAGAGGRGGEPQQQGGAWGGHTQQQPGAAGGPHGPGYAFVWRLSRLGGC